MSFDKMIIELGLDPATLPTDEFGEFRIDIVMKHISDELKIDGREVWEIIRDKSDKQNLELMLKCCVSELKRFEILGYPPSEDYFKQVAIIGQKEGHYEIVVRMCILYLTAMKQWPQSQGMPLSNSADIMKRLEKARKSLGA